MGYFVETTYKANDKVSGTLGKIIESLEKTEVASKSLMSMLDKLSLSFVEMGKIARTELGSMNAALGGMNAAIGRTNQKVLTFDERGVFALKVMSRMNTQAVVTAAGMDILGRSANNAMGSMRGLGKIGNVSGGSTTHGGAAGHGGVGGKIAALPGHLMNRVFDAWMMEQLLGGAIEPGIKREEAQLRMQKTGLFSKAETNQANAMAKQLTQLLPNTSITENLDKITELAQGMQRASTALRLAPAMLSKSSVMDFMSGDGGHIDKNKAFSTGRVLELLNLQTAPQKQQEEVIDLIARSSATTHGKAGPDALAKYFASMGASRFGTDYKQTIGFASYAIQELGQRAGSQMNAFQRAMNLGTITQSGAQGLMTGGILPKQDVTGMKSADLRRMVQGVDANGKKVVPGDGPGSGLFRRDLLQKDVHAWMYEAIGQILKTKKIDPAEFKKMDPTAKQNLLLGTFGALNMNAFSQSDMLGQQLETIAEHKINMAKSDTSSGNVQKTLGSKVQAVGKAWDDFMGTLVTSAPIMDSLKRALDSLTSGLRGMDSTIAGFQKTFSGTISAFDQLGKELPALKPGFDILMKGLDALFGGLVKLGGWLLKFWLGPEGGKGSIFDPGGKAPMANAPPGAPKTILDPALQAIRRGQNTRNAVASGALGGVRRVPPPPGGSGMMSYGPDGKPQYSATASPAPAANVTNNYHATVNAPIHGNVNMPDMKKHIEEAVGSGLKSLQRSQRNNAILHANTTSQATNPVNPPSQVK